VVKPVPETDWKVAASDGVCRERRAAAATAMGANFMSLVRSRKFLMHCTILHCSKNRAPSIAGVGGGATTGQAHAVGAVASMLV